MPDRSQSVTSLSISRHTLQSILHVALNCASDGCFGLIGCRNEQGDGFIIDQAEPISDFVMGEFGDFQATDCDLQHTVEKWHAAGASPCGIFFRSDRDGIPAVELLERHEAVFARAFPNHAGKKIIQLQLMLGTAGCLETFAWYLDGGPDSRSACAIPLILKEDGQENSKR